MAGDLIGIHRYSRTRKALLATVYSAELNTMPLNSKFSKVVSYIQDRIYVILKMFFPCISVLCLADGNKSGMEKFSTMPERQRYP